MPPYRCSPLKPSVSFPFLHRKEELQQLEISGISSGQGPVRGKRLGYSKPMPEFSQGFFLDGEAVEKLLQLLPGFFVFRKPKMLAKKFSVSVENVEVSRMSVEREKIKQ